MALNTFGWTPAEVTQDSAGNVVAGVTLTVFTDISKTTQVTGLYGKDGTPLANDVVVSDAKGRFGFKASDAYSLLYVYDGSTADPWPVAAHEALDAGVASHAQAVASAQAAANSAAASAALVGAPADTAIAAAVNGVGTQTRAALGSTLVPRSLIRSQPVDVDVNEAAAVVGEVQVPITTYAGGINAIVHPNLQFFDEGWNGWRYWMAYTPYNGGDKYLENPSIAVSNDGETWTVPAGLTNPVEPRPANGVDYLADPCLCMSADGTTMLLIFKVNSTTKQTVLRTSTDGVTWTPKVVLFANPYEDVSPALLWDGSKYRMWSIVYDTTVTGGTNTMYVRTASRPEGPWSAPTACTVSGLPNATIIWHIDIKRVGQQYHAALASAPDANPAAPTTQARLWFGKSNDGLAWEFARQPIMDTGNFTQQGYYKAALLPKLTPQGIAYDMYYSGTGDYRMYRTPVRFDRMRLKQEVNTGILAARQGLSPWVVADDFNRPDTTTGLGTALTGQAWTTATGNALGIASNLAYLPTAANSRAVIETGIADHRVGMTFTVRGTSGWILFRYVDGSNLWRVGHSSSGVMQLQKIVGGTLTSLTPSYLFNQLRDGDRLEVEAAGSTIRLFLNGREFYKATDPALSTGTKVGINVDNTAARFDNFTVRSV